MRKEIPILFSTEMVQAILQGRKTMTRRTRGLDKVNENPDGVEFFGFYVFPDGSFRAVFKYRNSIELQNVKCPYGNLGDLIYVRESFLDSDDYPCAAYHDDPENEPRFVFRADCPADQVKNLLWKPSIHMPKDAARIWLEVIDIRVERLQDITENDAKAEGAPQGILMDGPNTEKGEFHLEYNVHSDFKPGFKFLWMTIDGRESWNSNPWTWVVSFKVLSTAGRA